MGTLLLTAVLTLLSGGPQQLGAPTWSIVSIAAGRDAAGSVQPYGFAIQPRGLWLPILLPYAPPTIATDWDSQVFVTHFVHPISGEKATVETIQPSIQGPLVPHEEHAHSYFVAGWEIDWSVPESVARLSSDPEIRSLFALEAGDADESRKLSTRMYTLLRIYDIPPVDPPRMEVFPVDVITTAKFGESEAGLLIRHEARIDAARRRGYSLTPPTP